MDDVRLFNHILKSEEERNEMEERREKSETSLGPQI